MRLFERIRKGKGRLSRRRLFHFIAYFFASLAVLALFLIALVLAETAFYALTGRAISTWAIVLAALVAALLFSPLLQGLQSSIDRWFFREHLDTLQAIRSLGAGDLSHLPPKELEQALLHRICDVTHRQCAALDEREMEGGEWHAYPEGLMPPSKTSTEPFELILPIDLAKGRALLLLGPHRDGSPTDTDELEALQSLARFAAMALEHTRLIQEQTEQAQLESISRISSLLHSHDLKNRLNDLSFLAHNLERAEKLEAKDVKSLALAVRHIANRMQALMQRIQDPKAPIAPVIKACDLTHTVSRSIKERPWPAQVKVELTVQNSCIVAADEDLLRTVFDTLFDNALQAMNGKGTLTIEIGTVDGPEGRWGEVLVRDTGCGMEKSFLKQRLFKPFATTKKEGLGIGLFLCKRIMEAMSGKIDAESPGVGKGCTFTLQLPLWHAEAHEGESAC